MDVDFDLLMAIDTSGDTFISTDELIAAVQDLYDDDAGSDFDFDGTYGQFDVGDLADALDEMNNLPHIDTNDFMP